MGCLRHRCSVSLLNKPLSPPLTHPGLPDERVTSVSGRPSSDYFGQPAGGSHKMSAHFDLNHGRIMQESVHMFSVAIGSGRRGEVEVSQNHKNVIFDRAHASPRCAVVELVDTRRQSPTCCSQMQAPAGRWSAVVATWSGPPRCQFPASVASGIERGRFGADRPRL